MTEREEKIIKKGERKEEKKPSLWQRIKKPLAAGLLGASLLLHPVKKADAVGFESTLQPPLEATELIEKDMNLKKGWKLLLKGIDYIEIKEPNKAAIYLMPQRLHLKMHMKKLKIKELCI
ncbi:MAG: hypothetical protein QXK21_01530 [Candidatus Micrarchaeia archaeon]